MDARTCDVYHYNEMVKVLIPTLALSFAIVSPTFTPEVHAAKTKPRFLMSACDAAFKKESYSESVRIPPRLKTYIKSYKQGWKDLCQKKKNTTASLHRLLLKAKVIQKTFLLLFPRIHKKAMDLQKKGKPTKGYYRRVHQVLNKNYPAFIPAFEGSIIEYEYFKPAISLFVDSMPIGSKEDKYFFRNYRKIKRGKTYPWFRATWDFGGCLRFGEFNWVSAFRKLERFKGNLRGRYYRKLVENVQQDLFKSISSPIGPKGIHYPICTCKKSADVIPDLKRIQAYFKTNSLYREEAGKVDEIITKIRSNKIPIKSHKAGQCNG